jgi:LmbE family N-acetylglucosaminyl deacetylase
MESLTPLLRRGMVIVAHPDDEAVGCGGLLQRMSDPLVVFCTDGAPRDEFFWGKFGSREDYARIRREEAARALAVVGVARAEFLPPAENPQQLFVDQDLFLNIPAALRRLSALVKEYKPEGLLTTAYEGGHPDHDTCAFLGWWLSREHVIPAWEMPLYHRSPDGRFVTQRFVLAEGDEALFDATVEEVERKRAMSAAYASQAETLVLFNPAVERFRPQPAYDWSRPPHPGLLNYESWQWPMTGAQVAQAFGCCIHCHLGPPEPQPPGSLVRGLA